MSIKIILHIHWGYALENHKFQALMVITLYFFIFFLYMVRKIIRNTQLRFSSLRMCGELKRKKKNKNKKRLETLKWNTKSIRIRTKLRYNG